MAEKTDHQLSTAEADVLSVVTKEAMGMVGGSAGVGGRFGARFLTPHMAETTVETRAEPDVCLSRAAESLRESGAVIADPNATDGDYDADHTPHDAEDGAVWGVVVSGWMNMMPALVRVEAIARSDGNCRVHIRATGNEGFPTQQIGATAADRVAEAIARP